MVVNLERGRECFVGLPIGYLISLWPSETHPEEVLEEDVEAIGILLAPERVKVGKVPRVAALAPDRPEAVLFCPAQQIVFFTYTIYNNVFETKWKWKYFLLWWLCIQYLNKDNNDFRDLIKRNYSSIKYEISKALVYWNVKKAYRLSRRWSNMACDFHHGFWTVSFPLVFC